MTRAFVARAKSARSVVFAVAGLGDEEGQSALRRFLKAVDQALTRERGVAQGWWLDLRLDDRAELDRWQSERRRSRCRQILALLLTRIRTHGCRRPMAGRHGWRDRRLAEHEPIITTAAYRMS